MVEVFDLLMSVMVEVGLELIFIADVEFGIGDFLFSSLKHQIRLE